jgi:TadE-like protein
MMMRIGSFTKLRRTLTRLAADTSGLALVEFALATPILLIIFMGGAELTNYTVTKMRISQLALHIADNGSRIGADSLLTSPQVTETLINDMLAGADVQAGSLNLFTNGRVIISSLEPVASPNTTDKYKIHWQRCKGALSYTSPYPAQGATNLSYMGPATMPVKAPDNSGVIYVEIAYSYQPIVSSKFVPQTLIKDIAAMTIRGDRDFNGNGGTGVYNAEAAPVASC